MSTREDNMVTAACFNDWKGLVAGHGYIVKDFTVYTGDKGESIKLLKVKNPWKLIGDPSFKDSSHGDFTGRFSNDD
jgi:hypothetical protein